MNGREKIVVKKGPFTLSFCECKLDTRQAPHPIDEESSMAKRRETPTGEGPEGKGSEGPKALTGLEAPIITGAATLVSKFGPAVTNAIYEAYKGKTKLFIQIIASHQENDYYVVRLNLRNVSEHGIYLEKFNLPDSPDVQLEIGKWVSPEKFGLGRRLAETKWDRVEQSTLLPVHLPPGCLMGNTVLLRIGPISSEKDKLYELNGMKLGYHYSHLNEPTVQERDIYVRLRNALPTDENAT